MANKYYNPGSLRAAKVNDLFDTVARRYDLMNDLQSFGLHRLWKRRLVRWAGARPGERALDVCCGTGDLAFALARRGATVVGLDFSEPMLAVANARRQKSDDAARGAADGPGQAASNLMFVRGDAQQLPFPDQSFDIVTVAYGLRNLADWETGLREMLRVAKPGGRLLVLDFGRPNHALWRRMYFAYLRFFIPVLGALVVRDAAAYGYIYESLRHFAAQQGIADKMRELGLTGVRVANLLGGIMGINYGEKARENRG